MLKVILLQGIFNSFIVENTLSPKSEFLAAKQPSNSKLIRASSGLIFF